jgi:hypothetical protein
MAFAIATFTSCGAPANVCSVARTVTVKDVRWAVAAHCWAAPLTTAPRRAHAACTAGTTPIARRSMGPRVKPESASIPLNRLDRKEAIMKTERGNRRCKRPLVMGAAFSVAAAITFTGITADAAWVRYNMSECAMNRNVEDCINDPYCLLVSYQGEELVNLSQYTIHTFCPVPDVTDLPVGNVRHYYLSGYNAAGDAARGCIQFSNGSGESCYSSWTYLPSGYYQDYPVYVPAGTLWSQWQHTAYVQIELGGGSRLSRVMVTD